MHSLGAGGFFALALCLSSHSVRALDLRVFDASERKPLHGVAVEWSAGPLTNRLTVDSSVSIPSSPDHDLRLVARKPGFASMTMSWAPGKAPSRFDLALPAAQPIGGRIATPSSAPIAGARITINVPRRIAGPFVDAGALQATSDTNGLWRANSIPSSASYIEVEIFHPNFAVQVNDASREKLAAGEARCVMVPVFTVRGRVVDHEGRPVAGAHAAVTEDVMLGEGRPMHEAAADSRGQFHFSRLHPRRHLLGVSSDGFAPALQFIQVTNNPSPIEVRLNRGSPLWLRVQDFAGNPLADATVSLSEWPAGLRNAPGNIPGRWSYPGWEWSTGPDGRAVWPNAPTGSFAFSIAKSGYMRKGHHRIDASTNEHSVTLGPIFNIGGKVFDAVTGEPIPDFAINARFATISIFNGRTNTSHGAWHDHNRKTFKDGSFALTFDSPLLHGARAMHDWQFRAEADGYEPALSRIVLDSERGANIAFRLKREAIPQIDAAAPSDTNRVTAALVAHPKPAQFGGSITLYVRVRVAPGCYIYALEDSGCRNIPTSLTNSPSHFFKPDGPWRGPEPKVKDDGSRTLAGDILFRRRYSIVDHGVGPIGEKFALHLTFQVCNEALCWPPETIRLETPIDVLASQ